MAQGVQEQVRPLPPIKTKLHLFQVGPEMLRGNLMPRPHDAALEKRERGLNRVGVDVAHDVCTLAMLDSLEVFLPSLFHGDGVRRKIVTDNDFHILADILADVLSEGSRLGVFRMEEPQIAVALTDGDYNFFVVHAGDASFDFVYVASV